jgi:thioredoxin reductase (NADPH)
MDNIYDIVIIGGGVAGMAAGIYGGRSRLKTLILEKGGVGGSAYSTRELANYPGFPAGVSGPDLTADFRGQAEKFGAEIARGEVSVMELGGDVKTVRTKKGLEYKARSVILALGTEPRLLGAPGEKEFRGAGVSYCATCDAENFQDGVVAVGGNGDAALEEACYIAKFAAKVIVIVIHDEGIVDCNKVSAEIAFKNPKLEFVWNSSVAEIKGGEDVTSVVIRNLKTGVLTETAVDGVFFYVGMIPMTAVVKDQVETDKSGYIPTTEKMETSLPGVYAAGDCRQKYLRQVVTAAADGAVAATAAGRYLEEFDEYRETVSGAGRILLAFWSPLNEFSINAVARAEQLSAEYQGKLRLVKVDLYRKTMMARKYNVQTPGTFILVKNETACGVLSTDCYNTLEATLRAWFQEN